MTDEVWATSTPRIVHLTAKAQPTNRPAEPVMLLARMVAEDLGWERPDWTRDELEYTYLRHGKVDDVQLPWPRRQRPGLRPLMDGDEPRHVGVESPEQSETTSLTVLDAWLSRELASWPTAGDLIERIAAAVASDGPGPFWNTSIVALLAAPEGGLRGTARDLLVVGLQRAGTKMPWEYVDAERRYRFEFAWSRHVAAGHTNPIQQSEHVWSSIVAMGSTDTTWEAWRMSQTARSELAPRFDGVWKDRHGKLRAIQDVMLLRDGTGPPTSLHTAFVDLLARPGDLRAWQTQRIRRGAGQNSGPEIARQVRQWLLRRAEFWQHFYGRYADDEIKRMEAIVRDMAELVKDNVERPSGFDPLTREVEARVVRNDIAGLSVPVRHSWRIAGDVSPPRKPPSHPLYRALVGWHGLIQTMIRDLDGETGGVRPPKYLVRSAEINIPFPPLDTWAEVERLLTAVEWAVEEVRASTSDLRASSWLVLISAYWALVVETERFLFPNAQPAFNRPLDYQNMPELRSAFDRREAMARSHGDTRWLEWIETTRAALPRLLDPVSAAAWENSSPTPSGERRLLDILNTGNAAALRQLPQIGPALARAIVASRARGPFTSIDDLRRVRGIGAVAIHELKAHAESLNA